METRVHKMFLIIATFTIGLGSTTTQSAPTHVDNVGLLSKIFE